MISFNCKVYRIPPSTQFYAKSYNVDLSHVTATGMNGMVLKNDIVKFIKEKRLTKVDFFKNHDSKSHIKHQNIAKIHVSDFVRFGL